MACVVKKPVMSLAQLIKRGRERRGMTQLQLAQATGQKTAQTVSNWEAGRNAPNMGTMRALADAIGEPIEKLIAAASGNGKPIGKPVDDFLRSKGFEVTPSNNSNHAGFANIEPANDVPIWDVDIAASAWIDVPICQLDTNDPRQRAIIETGRFRLRIIGGCMLPDYKSGQLIEFKLILPDRGGLRIGRAYVVCRNDGTGTFKQLVAMDEDSITLAATNQRDYPGAYVVPRQEIARIARVEHLLEEPPAGKPVKILKRRGGEK